MLHRKPMPEPDGPQTEDTGGLRGAARRLGERARQDPRVQQAAESLRGRREELRASGRERADARLEALIEARRERRGETTPPEVAGLLEARRREREAHARQLRERAAFLEQATSPEESRVLRRVASGTPRLGGEDPEPRYTELLDTLAPGGDPAREMAVHRAVWALAERRVLAVSPHGAVRAGPQTLDPKTLDAPDTRPPE
ncbi:hypothetical protein [uncultured Deinococcus sp.]|uniref:hypothetical protein n=1 Tax=uncultured Deinococcus sp. TaxID=158789 RepID=UPI00258E81E8|nr:hypothetical protein [uncultured Deinococcus sp.]